MKRVIVIAVTLIVVFLAVMWFLGGIGTSTKGEVTVEDGAPSVVTR